MIIIDDILISDAIIQEEFICNLQKCKGGCCVDGDAGAPLAKDELKKIKQVYKIIQSELSEEAQAEIDRTGAYTMEEEFGYVTPAINGGICVYGYTDDQGIVKCLIEKAYYEGRTDFKKPISCHLYPIRITKTETYTALNYEPRESLCKPGCALGKEKGVKVYEFLKEPLIRKYGGAFYEALDTIAKGNV
ncbi:MAG: DUF3109 family protein [Chitinophagaceae bacterium]|nr:DUF3109 family protein [Chitinophagaceae bacterium]